MKRAAEIDNIPSAKMPRTRESDNVQALCDAIIANDELKVGKILQKISFNTINNKGFSALTLVGMQTDDDTCVKIINKYIQNHRLINNIASGVAYSGRKELLEYILGTMLTNAACDYNSIASHAAYGGHRELLGYILNIMPDNIALNYNYIAISAAKGGHRELLEHFLSIMPAANIAPDYNNIAASAARGRHCGLLKYIFNIMQKTNINTDYLLLEMIICNKLKLSENVIAQAINLLNNVNQHPADKPSLLFLAVKYNCTAAVEALLEKNVDTDDSFNGERIMMVAVKNRHLPIVNLLLKPKNYFIARITATTPAQQKVIDGLLCKITTPLHPAPATKGSLIDNSLHDAAVTQVVYNADNVLFWLNMMNKDDGSTLHATYAAQQREDNPTTTVLECIKHVHVATVKEKCGL